MKFKKIIASIVAVGFLALPFIAPVYAKPAATTDDKRKIMPVEEAKSAFLLASGVVEEVRDYPADKKAKFISLIDEKGGPVNLIVNDHTYIVDDVELTKGAQIIYFYDASRPMILIYPPQINPDVIALIDDSRIIKTDFFNQDLLSQDKMLKLNISADTLLLLPNGNPYKGELGKQKLLVIYDVSTKSIPAQTNPKKVVVLEGLLSSDDDLYDENYQPNVSKMNIVVEGDMVITEPKAYTNDEGAVMVPLRVIAEALNYQVTWNNETYSIALGDKISLKIDTPNYSNADTSITLDTAPALVNDTTYVPLNFFTSVLLLNNAYVFEGQIDINNGEKME
ncbi:MAG: copper amine oxidase N-terminal domain-containing protein [Syntrophomonadaceae bacterium]|nr:copper amine oxidase N-terminal domain-containing protein [Syntrophomonadaceae bacterium]